MVPFHSHAEYEIYYFQEGKCNYLIGNQLYVMEPGDLIIMHGMTLHRANVDPNYEYVRSVIHFDPSFVKGLFHHPHRLNVLKPFQQLGNFRIHLYEQHQIEIERILKALDDCQRQSDSISYNRFLITMMDLFVFLYEVCEQTMIERPDVQSDKVSHVQNIITFIEQNYMKDIQLSDLEDHLHLNKYYLSKIFKEVTGATIFGYLMQRRINEAKVLFLMDGEKSVTEVSYQVGFKHPGHFSRVFKQLSHCTADHYRKQINRHTNKS